MSGTFEHIHVPPTLISFAVTTSDIKYIISNEFKQAGHKVVLIKPDTDDNGLPVTESLKDVYEIVSALTAEGKFVQHMQSDTAELLKLFLKWG